MKKDIIVTAKTIEEAALEGASKLGVAREDVEIEVLEEPKKGFFGMGAVPAKVKVTYILKPLEAARNFIETLMADLDVFKGDYYVASNRETREGVEYTYYIRHSDPENAVDAGGEVHCMKYGIVRNTIYRVKITKVNPMDVSTENATLSLQIKVKNWKKTDHVEIVM